MAYSKKTWKARQGLGLNKFSIDGATPVAIVNQPDSVTQQGDALSAGNLNDLEDRIASAFDDVEESKADKTTIDDLQNQIVNLNTDVATLDAIVGCEAEIENTDPSEGQSILSSSRLIHHVNLLPSGEFGLVGARDVKFNQMVDFDLSKFKTYNSGRGGTWNDNIYSYMGLTFSVDITNKTVTVNGTATGDAFFLIDSTMLNKLIEGHSYLMAGCPSGGAWGRYCTYLAGGYFLDTGTGGKIGTCTSAWLAESTKHMSILISNGQTINNLVWRFLLCDLTAMNMASLTADQFRALFPASNYAYDEGSIVNLNPTAFSVRGVNLWDEEMEGGSINVTTGENSASSTTSRSVNYIPIRPNYSYYAQADYANDIVALFYDMDKNLITNVNGSYNFIVTGQGSFTSPQNAMYMRFYTGNNHLGNIQIADNSLPSSLKTVYHPYSEQTVPVSISGHYVNENCFDYVTNKTVNGVLRGEVHTKVGVVDLGSLTWTHSGAITHLFYAQLSDSKTYPINTDIDGIISATYNLVASKNAVSVADKEITFTPNTTYLYLFDSSKDGSDLTDGHASWLEDIIFQYALASEAVTYGEPLRSFSLTDYATVEPITPQTLPNRVDVPFSVLSKSNNGLIQQIAQNTADIADNKAILSQHEARLSNLEQVSGDYVPSDMQDYSTVPTGKASFALVETLKGVSRVENQLIERTTGASYTGTPSSWSNFGVLTDLYNSSHVMLVCVKVASVSANASVRLRYPSIVNLTSGWNYILEPAPNSTTFGYQILSNDGQSVSCSIDAEIVTDLTLYFNRGTIPTLAEIQSKYPELLVPRAYNAGEIVDATYTKVKSVGVNIWDEEWEVGDYNASNGEKVPSASLMRCKNRIRIIPSETYYIKCPNVSYTYYYDANGNYINGGVSHLANSSFSVPTNAYYMTFNTNSAYGTTYNHNVQICLNSYADKTTYHPYMTDTLPIPSVTLKGAGSVSDTLDVESGEITRRIGSYTFDGTETDSYFYTASLGRVYYEHLAAYIAKPSSATTVANLICDKFTIVKNTELQNASMNIAVNTSGDIGFCLATSSSDGSISDLKTYFTNNPTTIFFELVTPTTDSVSPTLDNTLRTEGGGTVYSDADVDGQFTMGFLNL